LVMASTNPTHSSERSARVRDSEATADRELERQGRRLGYSASRFFLIGVAIAVPGIVLLLIDHGWSVGVGIAVLLIACIPLVVGAGLLISSAVSRWAARRKLFA
jgi:hypothetical protein